MAFSENIPQSTFDYRQLFSHRELLLISWVQVVTSPFTPHKRQGSKVFIYGRRPHPLKFLGVPPYKENHNMGGQCPNHAPNPDESWLWHFYVSKVLCKLILASNWDDSSPKGSSKPKQDCRTSNWYNSSELILPFLSANVSIQPCLLSSDFCLFLLAHLLYLCVCVNYGAN